MTLYRSLAHAGSGAVLAAVLLVAPARSQSVADAPPARGAPPDEAVVEIVEFSDFECPYCALAVPVLDSLLARHGDEVRFVFRHYPLSMHPHAARAAEAAVEARGQGAFWEYHDLLFRNQEALADADLIGYADSLGLDAEGFERALVEGTHAPAVTADVALGRSLSVTGTPTFYVNGYRLVGVPPLWVFEAALRAFRQGLAEKRPLEPPAR